jgi:PPM family protein phosphatase
MSSPTQLQVHTGALSHVGNLRLENQDAFLIQPPLFLVADGMGGHAAGREAADIVVESFGAACHSEWAAIGDVHAALDTAVRRVRGLPTDARGAPGATVTGAALSLHEGRPSWLIFNIGDSRTYLMRNGELDQVTVDHSQIQALADRGVPIGVSDARRARNVTEFCCVRTG